MAEDRLHVLDVDVAVAAATRTKFGTQDGDSQCISVCHQTRAVAIANGRFVDLYGVGDNSVHPLTFLHQIALGDHVTHLGRTFLPGDDAQALVAVVATCVAFPVPGFLLVGAFVEVTESATSEQVEAVGSTGFPLLLGFRLYAGSVTQFVAQDDGTESRPAPSSVQVYFSFVEPIVGMSGRSIRCLLPCRRDMTPNSGSVVVLFQDSEWIGVLCWKERFSDRQVCLARKKQQSRALVVAEFSPDGQWLVVGDTDGQLSLLDFQRFSWDGHDVPTRLKAAGGKRLELGACSRSGVMTRDNPLELVRLIHSTTVAGTMHAYTSLRWWVCAVRNQQKNFILAGNGDGSLSVYKFVQEDDGAKPSLELKLTQIYPGLASGLHDAVRHISEPLKLTASKTADDTRIEFCTLSEMRWRTWRVKVTETGEGASKRYRVVWPSVKDSLDFPAFPIQVKNIKSIAMLSTSTGVSRLIAKALTDASTACTARYPIALVTADDRLQVVGLMAKAQIEASKESESSANELNESDESERDEVQEANTDSKTQIEQPPSEPTTIQDKYKLPPMEWKARTGAVNRDEARSTEDKGQKNSKARTSKLSRVDYNERVASVMQRVETLSGVVKSMRGSFQLFSSDVQQHMNLLSEQLEDLSRRRVTGGETAQRPRIG